MTKIFISYRRDDSGFAADRVHEDALDFVDEPSDVFMDIDGIPPGVDFVDHINEKVGQCDVLFALIGRDWLDVRDAHTGARRLDDPGDFVRAEIAAALGRGVPVVPILLGGATMPEAEDLPDDLKPLARRNAVNLGRASFKHDMEQLMAGLGLSKKRSSGSGGGALMGWLAGLVTVGALAAAGYVLLPMLGVSLPGSSEPRSAAVAGVSEPISTAETRTRRLGLSVLQSGQPLALDAIDDEDRRLNERVVVTLERGPFDIRVPGSHWPSATANWPLLKIVVSDDPALFDEVEPNETLENASPFFWACTFASYEFGSPEIFMARMGEGPDGVSCGHSAYTAQQIQSVSAEARTLSISTVQHPDDSLERDVILIADRLYMIVYVTDREQGEGFDPSANHTIGYGEVEFLELVFDE
ncbi:MAG: toll/interleukin-1 receptor domain-containing protein [Pseudomonadota bacterium]